jgi:uncharacterized GH25 family protein
MKATAMNRKSILVASMISACVIFLAGCDGGVQVKGRILDERGKPVKEARILLESRGESHQTESREDGSYDVGVMHAPVTPKGKLTVSKKGYETYELQFNSREELGLEREVVLKDLPPPLAQSNKAIMP